MPVPFTRVEFRRKNSRPNTNVRNPVSGDCKLVRNVWLTACLGFALVASGCGQDPVTDPAVPTGKTPSANTAKESPSTEKQADHGDPSTDSKAGSGAPVGDKNLAATSNAKATTAGTDSTATKPLKLTGIEIDVPESWSRVDPPTVRIVDAEFMIPRLTTDGFDGRLTFMAAGGDFDSNVSRWSGEFDREGGGPPGIDTLSNPAADTRIVDLRGTWKGPTFQQPGQPRQASRSNYRMLAAVVPFSARSSYFMKFVGPAELLEKHEAAFRKLVETARLQK